MSKAGKPEATPKEKKPGGNAFSEKVLPRLGDVMDWGRAGADQKEIAEKLGIPYSTFRSWVKKGQAGEERYAPLAVILKQAQEAPNGDVEAALYKKCLGYNAKIAKHYKVKQVEYDQETGRRISEREELREVFDEVHVPADTNAQIFFLTNRAPERWQRTPAPQQGDSDGNTGVVELPAAVPPEGGDADGA